MGNFHRGGAPSFPVCRPSWPRAGRDCWSPGWWVWGFGLVGPRGKAMGIIQTLHPQERILQDGEVIASIYRSLGTAAADQVVSRALGELALVLAGLASQIRDHELQSAERHL